MSKFFKFSWTVLKKTFTNFINNDSITYASSIAYYTIFSLPAILIIALSVGSTFYEKSTVQKELVTQVGKLIGMESANEIQKMVKSATFDPSGNFARVVGIITLVISATSVFLSLQSSLNYIWRIKPKPIKGFVKFLLNRLLSLAMVISLGFVLLVSLVIDTVMVFFQNVLSSIMEGITVYLITALNIVISISLVTVIFGLIFKVLPDARVKWRDVWVGAIVTMLLFTIGKYLIGLYLGNSSFNSAYGAAGSFVIVLAWVYYSTIIVLFGAELTSVYVLELGREIEPDKNAVKIRTVEIEKDGEQKIDE